MKCSFEAVLVGPAKLTLTVPGYLIVFFKSVLAGPASLVCAETLRQEGFTGKIVLVTRETALPYDRIKLSKVCCNLLLIISNLIILIFSVKISFTFLHYV